MARYVQTGDSIDYTPSSAVAVGDVVAFGTAAVGVATSAIAANALGAVAMAGVFAFPKATGASSAIARGTVVYWSAADSEATADANDGATPPVAHPRIGVVVAAAGDNDTEVRVRLG